MSLYLTKCENKYFVYRLVTTLTHSMLISLLLSFEIKFGKMFSYVSDQPLIHIASFKSIRKKHTPLMEQGQGDDGLTDPNALTSEDAPKSEFGSVRCNFLYGRGYRNTLPFD